MASPIVAGTLNITDALVSSIHPPKPSSTFALPQGALLPPLGKTTVAWDGSRWSSDRWD